MDIAMIKWFCASLIKNIGVWTCLYLINKGLAIYVGLSIECIQCLWGVLFFWVFFDNLIMYNDLTLVRNSHDNLVIQYTYLKDLYTKIQSSKFELFRCLSDITECMRIIQANIKYNHLNSNYSDVCQT
jgi:hypothetical protein